VTQNAKSVATRGVQLSVKLQPDADPGVFVRDFSHAPGIIKVTQTFPDETDQELAGLFVVEVDQTALKSAMKLLRSNSFVEYAADPAPRRLVR
jgi:hypothetical protein